MLVATDRIARRALPLAVLLAMTMVFPDGVPLAKPGTGCRRLLT